MMTALFHLCAPASNHYTICYPLNRQFLERAAVEDMKTSQLAGASIITAVDWMHSRVTLSLGGLEHPRTGCIPLFSPNANKSEATLPPSRATNLT